MQKFFTCKGYYPNQKEDLMKSEIKKNNAKYLMFLRKKQRLRVAF